MKERYLVDVNIPMYAAGAPSPWKEPCAAFLKRAAHNEFDAVTDAEVFQEILHRYLHIGRRSDAFALFDLFRAVVSEVLPIDFEDVAAARDLLERHPGLSSRDAIHAAVAIRHRLTIMSYDKHFDALPGVRRVEP